MKNCLGQDAELNLFPLTFYPFASVILDFISFFVSLGQAPDVAPNLGGLYADMSVGRENNGDAFASCAHSRSSENRNAGHNV